LKIFYKHIAIFSVVTGIIVFSIFQLVQIAYLKKSWKLKEDITIAFIGDSHIEKSIADISHKGILTFAQSGDNYIYTYSKLVKLLNDNPNIDTVVLGVDYHNIDKTSEAWYTSQSYINYKFPRLYPYMTFHDAKKLVEFNPWGYGKAIANLMSVQDLITNNNFVKMYGSYENTNDTMSKASLDSVVKSNYEEIQSATQFQYIDKINQLCQSRNITLILLTTPIHLTAYRSVVLDSLITNYVAQNHIQYLNYRDLKMDNTHYSDKFHINQPGSEYFTKYLLKVLRNK